VCVRTHILERVTSASNASDSSLKSDRLQSQVDQEHVFEDGEGALINPYQKYRMLLCQDGGLVATLFAGGEWDAVFRAHPF
jgi:hypothetical protein